MYRGKIILHLDGDRTQDAEFFNKAHARMVRLGFTHWKDFNSGKIQKVIY